MGRRLDVDVLLRPRGGSAALLAFVVTPLLAVAIASTCRADGAPQRLWEHHLVRSPAVAPLLGGDTLFLAGTDRKILCLDARSGHRRWRRTTSGQIGFGIVRADSCLLFGIATPTPAIVAVECRSGRQRWAKRLGSAVVGIVRSGRTVAVLEYGGSAHGFDLRDGTEKWERKLKGPMAGMAIDGTSLRILARKDSLWSLDLADGKRVWAVQVTGTHPSPPVAAGGRILRLTYEGDLVSHDGSTGAEAARARAPQPQTSPPGLVGGGRCVVVATGGEARGFDLPDLGVTWSQPTGETIGTDAIAAGNAWILACESTRVLGLRMQDGTIAWTLKLSGSVSVRPAADKDLIVFADERGHVAVYTLEGGS